MSPDQMAAIRTAYASLLMAIHSIDSDMCDDMDTRSHAETGMDALLEAFPELLSL